LEVENDDVFALFIQKQVPTFQHDF